MDYFFFRKNELYMYADIDIYVFPLQNRVQLWLSKYLYGELLVYNVNSTIINTVPYGYVVLHDITIYLDV